MAKRDVAVNVTTVSLSPYGQGFDNLARRWEWNENEHDRMHPDRNACGGVGGCPMMREAAGLENAMIEQLNGWRTR
jgi:hypothetical protein